VSRDIPIGSVFSRQFTVDEARAIDFMGPELRVYATPWIVQDLEYACRDWLLDHIDRVSFEIVVRDAVEIVATARHTRVIVDKARLVRMIQAKRDRAG
jgi:fluoroacetyl-CoA thioesterase